MKNIYCVIDLEATCWERDDVNKQPHEIIEIGAVLLDENFNYIKEYSQFVKPQDNPILSEYCKDLTTITQKDVDNAPPIFEVIPQFAEWLAPYENVIFCSWGNFDKNQMQKECDRYLLEFPFDEAFINIKEKYAEVLHRSKKTGLRKALRILNISFEGTQHRGIDDAKMISKVFKMIMDINQHKT